MSGVLENVLTQIEKAENELNDYSKDVDVLRKITTYKYNGLGAPIHKFFRVKRDAYSNAWRLEYLNSSGFIEKDMAITGEAALQIIEDTSYYCPIEVFEQSIKVKQVGKLIGIYE